MGKDKPRLGRGLASLLGAVTEPVPVEVPESAVKPSSVTTEPHSISASTPASTHSACGGTLTRLVPVNRIDPNPYQPRLQTDPQTLAELVESVRRHGVIQPIVVRPRGEHYELVAGQRRLEAARKLEMVAIPAIVRELTDQEVIETALIENIQREDLNCVDRALAYKNFQDVFSLTSEQIAERLGQDRTTVTNYLRLLALPEAVLEMLKEGRLSMGHARALAALENPIEQAKLALRIVQLGLSVRQVEQMVARIKSGAKPAVKDPPKNPNILDLEQQMTRSLSAKVQIVPSRKKGTGKVVIQYYTLDDFDRILDRICGADRDAL